MFSLSWRSAGGEEERPSPQEPGHDVIRRAGDVVIRRRVTLWEPEPPKSPVLMAIYRYWESLRPDGLLPTRASFDLDKLRPLMGMTSIVDVESDDPADYQVRLLGSNVPLGRNMSNMQLRQIESGAYRDGLAKDYENAKHIGAPAYHEVVACLDYRRHSYARLIVPFSKDGRTVSQLMVCSAHQTFTDLLKLVD